MDFQELKTMGEKERETLLQEKRKEFQALRFQAGSRQLKDVRALRDAKKMIARILTLRQH